MVKRQRKAAQTTSLYECSSIHSARFLLRALCFGRAEFYQSGMIFDVAKV